MVAVFERVMVAGVRIKEPRKDSLCWGRCQIRAGGRVFTSAGPKTLERFNLPPVTHFPAKLCRTSTAFPEGFLKKSRRFEKDSVGYSAMRSATAPLTKGAAKDVPEPSP